MDGSMFDIANVLRGWFFVRVYLEMDYKLPGLGTKPELLSHLYCNASEVHETWIRLRRCNST